MNNSGRKSVKVAAVGTAGKVGKASKASKTTSTIEVHAEAPKVVPSHTQIAERSYELYLARGGAHGHDVEDWLQAESELAN